MRTTEYQQLDADEVVTKSLRCGNVPSDPVCYQVSDFGLGKAQ